MFLFSLALAQAFRVERFNKTKINKHGHGYKVLGNLGIIQTLNQVYLCASCFQKKRLIAWVCPGKIFAIV